VVIAVALDHRAAVGDAAEELHEMPPVVVSEPIFNADVLCHRDAETKIEIIVRPQNGNS